MSCMCVLLYYHPLYAFMFHMHSSLYYHYITWYGTAMVAQEGMVHQRLLNIMWRGILWLLNGMVYQL